MKESVCGCCNRNKNEYSFQVTQGEKSFSVCFECVVAGIRWVVMKGRGSMDLYVSDVEKERDEERASKG